MEQQLSTELQYVLFDMPETVITRPADGRGLTERFAEFHADNPHVYYQLKRLALAQRRAGNDRGSINQLFEVLRWQVSMSTAGDDFKLNNNWRSFYARLLMEQEPELAGFFETRGGSYVD